jgi:membrane protease YdiL (CAAX protease family)
MRQLIGLFVVAALMPWPLMIAEDHWWAFVLATAAIVVALRLLFGSQWRDTAGLRVPPVQILLAVMAFVLIAAGSKILLHHVYEAAGLRADAAQLEDQIGFLFQAFNEEIFFRAFMIGFFLQIVPSASLVSLGAAFLFAAAHFLLYRFSNPMHLALSMAALATLFLGGVAMNNLYLAFRHIGFSWALHAGWNVVWLPTAIYDAATNARLYEPQMFDRILGSPAIVAAACAAAASSFALLAWRGRSTGLAPEAIEG